MNQRIWAAVVPVAMILAPGAVLASSGSGSARVVSYTRTSATLVVSSGLSVETLQVLPATSYRFIDCPDLIPPESACRTVANKWNLALFQNQPAQHFGKLLDELGANSCSVEYWRSDTPDANGAFGLIEIRPTLSP